MKTLEEQLEIVKRNFPGLDWDSINPNLEKGNALVMSWSLFSSNYLYALKIVLGVTEVEYDLSPNFDYNFLTDKHTEDMIGYAGCLGAEMDLGQKFKGISHDTFIRNHYDEWYLCGAPTFVVALQLLIHPQILAHDEDLSIICAGDSTNNPGFREDRACPIFYFQKGKLRLGIIAQDKAFEDCGCATLSNLPPTP